MECGEWDERAQRCCAIVDSLCSQPLHGRNTAFEKPSNHTFFGMTLPRRRLGLPYVVRRESNGMASTMMDLHRQGYTASTHDLQSNFALYRQLLEQLDIPTNIPVVLFFHGSATPPSEILDGRGFVLEGYASQGSFAGPLLYGSVAAKAASFTRPYLYLCMMIWPESDGSHPIVVKPQNETQARGAANADVILIGSHTETPMSNDQYITNFGGTNLVKAFPETFVYPELAIHDVSRVIPLACFTMDCPMIYTDPFASLMLRERLSFPGAQDAARERYMHRVVTHEEEHNRDHLNARKRDHSAADIAKFNEEWSKIKRSNPYATFNVQGYNDSSNYAVMTENALSTRARHFLLGGRYPWG